MNRILQILSRQIVLTGFAVALALAATGCHHLGPKTVAQDRYDYSTAVADSWKQQTLLNIVKLRYLDLPVFLDVGQIVSGYSLETTVNVGGQISSSSAVQGNSALLGAQGRFVDRPTITYTPLTGDRFLRGLVEPIPPHSIFSLMQSGYAADFVLGLGVESLNGLQNRSSSPGGRELAEPEFVRAVQLFRELQLNTAVGFQVQASTNELPSTVVFFRREKIEPSVQEKISELRRLLEVEGTGRFQLVFGPVRGEAGTLAVQTRSILQVLMTLAAFVDVPSVHLEQQRVTPSRQGAPETWPIRVKWSESRPADSYAAVNYWGGWYWIDDRDLKSKRAFGFIMFLFTLANSGAKEQSPLLTIPTQ